jgi:hypothetical protein
MRGKTFRGAWLLAAWGALAVGGVRGQAPAPPPAGESDPPLLSFPAPSLAPNLASSPAPSVVRGQSPGQSQPYAPADPQLPIPLGSNRPEDGGLYLAAEYMFFRWNNPTKDQVVAVRGFQASDTSLGVPQGTFFGSGDVALHTAQLTGADSYEPGFRLTAGWHFGSDGSSLSVSYFYLADTKFTAAATLAAPGGNYGNDLSNTFLYSGVYNFPPEYAGPNFKVGLFVSPNTAITPNASSQATYGVWNGASVMTLLQIMRFQEYEMTYRQPIFETENSRCSGLVGPRFDWIWDSFRWSSTGYGLINNPGAGATGNTQPGDVFAGPQSTGVYSTYTSNRMYGVHAGCEYECYLGHGFATVCQLQVALLMDAIHEEAEYSLEDKFQGLPESKRGKRLWNIVPEVQGMIGLQWYPYEFIQFQVGYQAMAFFNTLADRIPIDFNYSNVNPHWSTVSRYFDGFTAGMGITF